jgi:hypothetical protein
MLLNKFQSSIGLIILGGATLIILTYFILNPSKSTESKEGFKNNWIVSKDELHAEKIKAENERHAKSGGTHLSTSTIKKQLRKLIKEDPNLIEEIGEIISDTPISNKIDKTLKSKPVLNKVHDVIATPKITRQIEQIMHKDPSFKKINSISQQIKNVKKDIKKDMNNDIKQIHKNIKKDIKNVQVNIQKNVNKAVKKVEIKRNADVKKLLPKDTPYDRILRAHNKLSEKNANIIEQKRKELAEIREIRKQIQKTEDTQKINIKETSKLTAEVEAIHKSHAKAVKELKENKELFLTLVKQNLKTQNS